MSSMKRNNHSRDDTSMRKHGGRHKIILRCDLCRHLSSEEICTSNCKYPPQGITSRPGINPINYKKNKNIILYEILYKEI